MEKMVVKNTSLSIRILDWVVEIQSFFSKLVANTFTRWKFPTKLAISEKLLEDEKLSESDVKKVMDELGVAYNPDSDKIGRAHV